MDGRNPVRVVIDGRFTSSMKAKIFQPSRTKTIIFVSKRYIRAHLRKKETLLQNGVEVCELPSSPNGIIPITDVLSHLGSIGMASILVEGGAKTYNMFLSAGLADKLYVLIAPKIFGKGVEAYLPFPFMCKNLLVSDSSAWNVNGDILLEANLRT